MNTARRTRNTLKALAATTTLAASINLGIQQANGHTTVLAVVFTALAIALSAAAFADDVRNGIRYIGSARAHRRALNFRNQHGDPARWDDGEYEAYFALTAPQKPTVRRNIHPAA